MYLSYMRISPLVNLQEINIIQNTVHLLLWPITLQALYYIQTVRTYMYIFI